MALDSRRATSSAWARWLVWAAVFGLALWLMLGWNTTMHTDFAQNAWLPARLVTQGADPYSPTRLQVDAALGPYSGIFTGREAFNSGANYHFIYPTWLALAFSPLASLPLDVATAVWRALTIVLLLWACAYILRTTSASFRANNVLTWAAIGLTLFLCFIFKGSVQNLFIGQFAAVELALFAAIWGWLLKSGHAAGRKLLLGDSLVGLALAVLANKPQVAGLALVLIGLWAISRRRFAIPISAAVSLALLLLVPAIFYPRSISDWLSIVVGGQASSQASVSASVWGLSYQALGGDGTPWVAVAFALTLVGIAALLPFWWRDLKDKAAPVPASLLLTLCANSFISPYMLGYEHMLLLLPALAILARLGLPRPTSEAVAGSRDKLLRLGLYAWLGALPVLTSVIQVQVQAEYPVVLQSALLLPVCWWMLKRET
jgi:Glycosyltransferase family 87